MVGAFVQSENPTECIHTWYIFARIFSISQLMCLFSFINTFCGQSCRSDSVSDGSHRYDVCAFNSHAQESACHDYIEVAV